MLRRIHRARLTGSNWLWIFANARNCYRNCYPVVNASMILYELIVPISEKISGGAFMLVYLMCCVSGRDRSSGWYTLCRQGETTSHCKLCLDNRWWQMWELVEMRRYEEHLSFSNRRPFHINHTIMIFNVSSFFDLKSASFQWGAGGPRLGQGGLSFTAWATQPRGFAMDQDRI